MLHLFHLISVRALGSAEFEAWPKVSFVSGCKCVTRKGKTHYHTIVRYSNGRDRATQRALKNYLFKANRDLSKGVWVKCMKNENHVLNTIAYVQSKGNGRYSCEHSSQQVMDVSSVKQACGKDLPSDGSSHYTSSEVWRHWKYQCRKLNPVMFEQEADWLMSNEATWRRQRPPGVVAAASQSDSSSQVVNDCAMSESE